MLMERSERYRFSRLFILCIVLYMNLNAYVGYGNNVLRFDDCVVVQKLGYNTSNDYGFIEVSRHDSLFYMVTNEYNKYQELSVDSTYSFLLCLMNEGQRIDQFSNSANRHFIGLGENKIFTDQLTSRKIYELVVMELSTEKLRNFQLPQGMNVERSAYELFEDKALDYFSKYVSECGDYSENHLKREWLSLQQKKRRVSNLKYIKHILDQHPINNGEIRKTSLFDVYLNVYVRKYNNNIIDSDVMCNVKNESEFEKVELKYKSSRKSKNKKRIISVCANCSYNGMNHVEVTIGNRKELQTYIVVMREDGSLFDIVSKEEIKYIFLHYSVQI